MEALPEVLGQKFDSYLTETGEVVFSQKTAAIGLDIHVPQLTQGHISEKLNSLRESNINAIERKNGTSSPKAAKIAPSKGFGGRTLKVMGSIKPIHIVSMSELTELVCYLAERGHARAIAMQQASFAIMLQQSVDVAYGTTRESREYTEAASRPWLCPGTSLNNGEAQY